MVTTSSFSDDGSASSGTRRMFLGTLMATSIASFIVQFNSTLLNVALPSISADLDASISQLQWVVNAYTLGYLGLLLPMGAACDRLGAKQVFLSGCFIFAAASLACAFTNTPGELISARVLQGFGAAQLVPSAIGLVRRSCGDDQKQFALAIGIWTAAGGAGFATGPVLGGALLADAGWHMLFAINVPLCLVALFVGARYLVSQSSAPEPIPADWLGQAVIVASLLSLTWGITESRQMGIYHPHVAGALCLAALGAAALIRIEKSAQQPVLAPALFRNVPFTATLAYGFLINSSFAGVFFLLTLFLQSARGYSPWEAGLAFIPLTLTFVVSNTLGGRLVSKFGFRFPMAGGALTAAAGYALLFALGETESVLRMLFGFVLIPAGVGVATPAMTAAALACVERAVSSTVSAVVAVVRQMAALIGVAFAGLLVGSGSPASLSSGLDVAAILAIAMLVFAAAVALLVKVGGGQDTPRSSHTK